jgi:hypothetical protein
MALLKTVEPGPGADRLIVLDGLGREEAVDMAVDFERSFLTDEVAGLTVEAVVVDGAKE